ncbi:hypothetical protein C8A03DRAFT_13566 [Achaetomium macrosporum]|uniref:Ecp2 effector protein-like domain-containing protein n=1 Tax=Achaetomium macrosporum TaxID=79813 RepID=A0AAN7HDU0_9PEZI|nr:hypothetical protein C8A03DRAFT_13566 [Achaetomium macrosporum]
MPSLSTKLLVFTLSTAPTALTAPAPFSLNTRDAPSHLSLSNLKRAVYTTASSPGTYTKDDYCGEANPAYTSSPSTSPLATDCVALYNAHPGPGYWTISSADTAASEGEGRDGWVRLGQSGSCAFEVRWSSGNGNGDGEVGEYKFGTNDLRFYIRAHVERATEGEKVDGRVGVSSTVWCDTGSGMGFVDWRVILS